MEINPTKEQQEEFDRCYAELKSYIAKAPKGIGVLTLAVAWHMEENEKVLKYWESLRDIKEE